MKIEKRNPVTCVFCGKQIGLTLGPEKADGLCKDCDK